MAHAKSAHGEIDWSTAHVEDGTLTVQFADATSKPWADRVGAVSERLERAGSGWGKVQVSKKQLQVTAVTPGAEEDLRHFLESAVAQANADFAPPEDSGTAASDPDAKMAAAFQAFADDEER
ncbi:MAG: hypothetical protein ACR2ND_12200 [Solirubrobacteraceae bacterium]